MLKLYTGITFAAVLWILAWIDVRRRVVPAWGPGLIAALSAVRILSGILAPSSAAAGFLLMGGTVFLLAVATGGIGGGDIKLLGACGAFLGLLPGANLLFLSFFLSGIFSAGLLILPIFVGNAGVPKIRELPFVPFIALAASLIFFRNPI